MTWTTKSKVIEDNANTKSKEIEEKNNNDSVTIKEVENENIFICLKNYLLIRNLLRIILLLIAIIIAHTGTNMQLLRTLKIACTQTKKKYNNINF